VSRDRRPYAHPRTKDHALRVLPRVDRHVIAALLASLLLPGCASPPARAPSQPPAATPVAVECNSAADCRVELCCCRWLAAPRHEPLPFACQSDCRCARAAPSPAGPVQCTDGKCALPPAPSAPAAAVHPDLACRRDSDCVFAHPGPCGWCPVPNDCRTHWRTATNRRAYEREDRRYPRVRGQFVGECERCSTAKDCPPGTRWLGSRALCIQDRCEVR